jgi:hypothetical protein
MHGNNIVLHVLQKNLSLPVSISPFDMSKPFDIHDTRKSNTYDLTRWPLDRLNDSVDIDIVGAFGGGWSSDGLMGTSLVPTVI